MFDDKKMDKLIKKLATNPEWREVYEELLKWSQKASMLNWTVEEMANVCMMGYAIGKDPGLQQMIENMSKIDKLGLDIVDK